MPVKLVPTVRTSCTQSEMIAGFVKGWVKQFHSLPKKESIGVLYAQNALETGGTTYCWNWNIGNVKFQESKNKEDDDGVEYMMLHNVWEINNKGIKIFYNPPHTATWFRSFPTLEDGISFHLNFLKNLRYKLAWEAVENGDPVQFAHLLKVAKYYTAPEADYIKLMNNYFKQFIKSNTFESTIEKLQPKLNVDADGKMTIIGELNLLPQEKKSGIWDSISNIFFNKNIS